MSDDEINPTFWLEYNYSSYYELEEDCFPFYNIIEVGHWARVVLPTIYRRVFIISFFGNGLVVCVFVKIRKQTNLTDICLLNLALSDLLFALTLPFYSHYHAVGHWTFGGLMCSLTSGSQTTGFFSSIFFMVALMLDRYMVIMHNDMVACYRTARFGIALTVVVWMLSLCVSVPSFIFTKVTGESDVQSCSYTPENELYSPLVRTSLGLMIPLLVMIVCCTRIIPRLVNTGTAKKHRIVTLIISIVFWTPYNIVLFLKFLYSKGQLQGDEYVLETNLAMSLAVTEIYDTPVWDRSL